MAAARVHDGVLERRTVRAGSDETGDIDGLPGLERHLGPERHADAAADVADVELAPARPRHFPVHADAPAKAVTRHPAIERRDGVDGRREPIRVRRRQRRHLIERRHEQLQPDELALRVEERPGDAADPDFRVDEMLRKRTASLAGQLRKHAPGADGHVEEQVVAFRRQRVDAADDAVELDVLAVPFAGEKVLERRAGRHRQASGANPRHRRLEDDRRKVAGPGHALDAYLIANGHRHGAAAHLDEDALPGVLHEQQAPLLVGVRHHPFDGNRLPEEGGVSGADDGDARQRRGRRFADIGVGRPTRRVFPRGASKRSARTCQRERKCNDPHTLTNARRRSLASACVGRDGR